ncbi:MAG TPA: hypothetical protein DCM05_12260 [Elusimicrobia bacterium]|nr:hypothetical protein [Elusimicrobiota bacterium]
MKIKAVDCLEWKAPNKPGELLRFAAAFKKKGVDMDILWNCGPHGLIGGAAKKPAKLAAALKELGVQAQACTGFHIMGKDKAGALVKVFEKLSAAGINVDFCTALAAKGKFAAVVWVKDGDVAMARKALKA